MKYCKHCNETLSDDALFCTNCGAKIEISESSSAETTPQYCAKCGTMSVQGTAFCENCGAKFEAITSTPIQTERIATANEIDNKGFYCTNCGENIGKSKRCLKCGTKAVKNVKRHCRYCGGAIEQKKCSVCHTPYSNNFLEIILRFFSIIIISVSFFGSLIDLITGKPIVTVLIEFFVPLLLCIFVMRKKQIFKIKKLMIEKKIKPLLICLVYILVCAITIGGIGLSANIFNNKPNEAERQLINYILENGEYDAENKVYVIDESTVDELAYYNYRIEYSTDTKKLTFKENQYVSEASMAIFTTMYWEYGADKQEIEINMIINEKYGVKSTGIIYPSTYTYSNKTIYSFESTSTNQNIQSICEGNVYSMLSNCQLLMIDADTGLVPFGFEKGLFK